MDSGANSVLLDTVASAGSSSEQAACKAPVTFQLSRLPEAGYLS